MEKNKETTATKEDFLKAQEDLTKRINSKKASVSEIMSHLVTGLLMSFGGATEKKPEPKPPVENHTVVIIYRERRRKGLLKWIAGLFW
jgi:hypothetical protein